MKAAIIGFAIAFLCIGCGGSKAPAKKYTAVPVAQPMFQVIPANVDPNTARIPGAPGNIVQNAQPDGRAWTLGTNGVWQTFPTTGGADAGLSPIAAGSTLCNPGDASAIPVGCTRAQMQTSLGIQPSNNVNIDGGTISNTTVNGYVPFKEYSNTLGSAAGSINVSGLNGDVDGDYRVVCKINNNASSNALTLTINASSTNEKSISGDGTHGIAIRASDWTISNAAASPQLWASGDVLYIIGTLTAKSGHPRIGHFQFYEDLATDNSGFLTGFWSDTATNITSFGLAGTQTNNIGTGSWCRMTAMASSF